MSPQPVQIRIPVSLRRLFPQSSFVGCADIRVQDATQNSQECQPGMLFAALPGTHTHGEKFVPAAIARGAAALLVQRPVPEASVPQCVVQNVRKAYAELCSAMAGKPADRLCTVGVTGTNGKTTTTWVMRSILEAAGRRTGLLGTIEYHDGTTSHPSKLTTPDSRSLTDWLASMHHRGCTHAVMELSSHALHQHRADGIALNVGIVTNVTQDHFDYHIDFQHYLESKARIGGRLKESGVLLINLDDPGAARLKETLPNTVPVQTFGIDTPADYSARILESSLAGNRVQFNLKGLQLDLWTPLAGKHNVSNCLAAAAAAHCLGLSEHRIVTGIEQMTCVPGRLEAIRQGQPFTVLVDYAHTDDALARAVQTCQRLTENKLICVFGAGGDRDRTKRPLLAKAAQSAEVVIVTSDNPRSENPEHIIHDILQGFDTHKTPVVEVDRAEAIRHALQLAEPGDCVLIAGKGHETTQTVGGKPLPFDDRDVTRRLLRELGYLEKKRSLIPEPNSVGRVRLEHHRVDS